ncbi:C-5 cytosine-specific DNA methylase [Thalassospira sp. 11-3]|nr:C-5 cytosine-specific DNA methylase [Thalassospira sp. 11-3]
MNKIITGSDFSGVGAFDQALDRLGIQQNKIFACEMDRYARQSYIANYGDPAYFPKNVRDRKVPKKPLDIYVSTPPCQVLRDTGKRGALFYNSHNFIMANKPRAFILENDKRLLVHDKQDKTNEFGQTFNRWVAYLGGKSVNGNPVVFPHPESVPYHMYYTILNVKDYGTPYDLERVFIVGIRDDADNQFMWPKPEPLQQQLLSDKEIKLTPRDQFRAMGFPDSFKIEVSDTQAYKQAGNSICVGVLAAIIGKLPFVNVGS